MLLAFQSGGHERKFAFSPLRVAAVLHWLRHVCQPNSKFPRYRVSTIYYDTSDRILLREKLNSDYVKTKVRIRWYTGRDSTQHTDEVWLEVKQKVGAQRRKIRVQLPYSSPHLATLPLEHSILTEEIPRLLSTHGIHVKKALLPALELSYERHRFFDPLNNVDVCLDDRIAIAKVNRRLFSERELVRFHTAILEIKGTVRCVPGTLQPLLTMGCRKVSVSKYLMCYQRLTREA
jgi:hypothetical protein